MPLEDKSIPKGGIIMAKKQKEDPRRIRLTFTVQLPDGTKKRKSVEGKTRKEAEKKRRAAMAEYERGSLALGGEMTVRQYAERWLERYARRDVERMTRATAERVVTKYLIEVIGAVRLCDLRRIHIQQCFDAVAGMSGSELDKARTYIRQIIRLAIADQYVTGNPLENIEEPDCKKGKRRALTQQERDAFLSETVRQHPYFPFFAVIFACGLRPGEVRALSWPALDFKNLRIRVFQACEADSKEVKPPKSDAGYRTLPMPDWLAVLLDALPREAIFIFHGKDGKPISKQRYERAWNSFLREMDLAAGAQTYRNQIVTHSAIGWDELTPYYLRHTFCTACAESDVDLKTTQYFMGHSSITMTANIYTTVTDKLLDNSQELINNLYTFPKNNACTKNVTKTS
jgi:integrase